MPEKEVRLIDARKIVNDIALYLAENAYLNDTALDALKMVTRWVNEAPTIDPESLRAQWISVEDRLPEQCGMGCLLCATNCYGQQRVFEGFTGYMEGGKFQWHTNLKDVDLDVWNVTHWMPLPKPPKKGE